MREGSGHRDDDVVVPDDVLLPGQGSISDGPLGRMPTGARPIRRGGVPIRAWVVGLVLVAVLLVLGTSGIRTWWAHRLHDVTGGAWAGDYVLGLVIGALPLIGVALGRIGTRGARRILRMFLFGAIGFCITYLLSPSLSRYVTDSHAGRVFDQQAPGYLWGVLTSELLWLLVVVFAWWRLRTWRRTRASRRRGPA